MTKSEKLHKVDFVYFNLMADLAKYRFDWEQQKEIDKAYNEIRQEIENEN